MSEKKNKKKSGLGNSANTSAVSNTPTFLHVGYPKCASSYLQRLIFPSIGNLADLTKLDHETKWMLFKDNPDLPEFRRRVEAAVEYRESNRNHQILSYEGLLPNPFQGFTDLYWEVRRKRGVDTRRYHQPDHCVPRRLAKAFPEAYVIIVIREQIDWVISHYKMYWRRGHTSASIDSFCKDYKESYDKVVGHYLDVFGPERMLVVPFELLCDNPSSFVNQVTDFIAPGCEPKIPNKRENSAPELLRDVMCYRSKRILKSKLKGDDRRSNPLNRIGSNLILWSARLAARPYYTLKYGKKRDEVEIDEKTLNAIRPAIAESNRKLEEMTGLDLKKFGYYVDNSFGR